jgi:hypothetical protein
MFGDEPDRTEYPSKAPLDLTDVGNANSDEQAQSWVSAKICHTNSGIGIMINILSLLKQAARVLSRSAEQSEPDTQRSRIPSQIDASDHEGGSVPACGVGAVRESEDTTKSVSLPPGTNRLTWK